MAAHVSYSQLTQFMRCGKQYELQRLAGVPQLPSVWIVAGKAFHAAAEKIALDYPARSLDLIATWKQAWEQELADAIRRTPVPVEQWRTAGRVTKDKPNKEDLAWWEIEGLEQVKVFEEWLYSSDFKPAIINNTPAVEIETSAVFGTEPVKGFCDIVLEHKTEGWLLIVDYKSGSRQPLTATQLGSYATSIAMTTNGEVRVTKGAFYMTRKGELTEPEDLTRYSEKWFTDQFTRLRKAIDQGLFLAHIGDACNMCDVKSGCYAGKGADAWIYDPDHPQYQPSNKEIASGR